MVYTILIRITRKRSNESPILTGLNCGYKQTKARIGQSRVRKWEWASFVNPARHDSAVFYHWRRKQDCDNEYAFANFNKVNCNPGYQSSFLFSSHRNGFDSFNINKYWEYIIPFVIAQIFIIFKNHPICVSIQY